MFTILFYLFYFLVFVSCIQVWLTQGLPMFLHYLLLPMMLYFLYFAPQSWHRQRTGDAVGALFFVLILRLCWF